MRDLSVISVDDALTTYDAATGAEVEALNNLSADEANAACDVASVDYDAATGAEAAAILAETEIIETHDHNHERVFAKNQSPTATVKADPSATAFSTWDFTAAGDSTFGTALQVLGSDDTPMQAGMTKYDFNKVMITAVNSNTLYKMRFYCGATVEIAEAAGEFTDIWFRGDDTNPQQAQPVEIEFKMKRHDAGSLVWVAIANATGAQTASAVFALHEYPE